jgi:hypothetical protein
MAGRPRSGTGCPDYTDYTPQTEPGIQPVLPEAARQRLQEMLGSEAEIRQSQSDYAAALAMSFDRPDAGPNAGAGAGRGGYRHWQDLLAIWHLPPYGQKKMAALCGFQPIHEPCSIRLRRS